MRQPPDPPPAVFLERLDLLREEAGKKPGQRGSIPEIAKECGFSRSLIQKWKSKAGSPSGRNLAALATYFGVTMDWLWGRPGYERERPGVSEMAEAAGAAADPPQRRAGDRRSA